MRPKNKKNNWKANLIQRKTLNSPKFTNKIWLYIVTFTIFWLKACWNVICTYSSGISVSDILENIFVSEVILFFKVPEAFKLKLGDSAFSTFSKKIYYLKRNLKFEFKIL